MRVRAGLYEFTYVIDPHTTITYSIEKMGLEWEVRSNIYSTEHSLEDPGHWESAFRTKGHAVRAIKDVEEKGKYEWHKQLGWVYKLKEEDVHTSLAKELFYA